MGKRSKIIAEIEKRIVALDHRPGLCLYYAHHTLSVLWRHGFRAVVQAGSLQWPRIRKEDDDGVMNIAREAAQGCIQANMYILGVDTPKAKAFEDTFHKFSNGKWPSFVIMEAYIGTKMFIEAVKKAGSFDTDKVIKAFENLTWEGPIGPITMRAQDHQAQTPVVIADYAAKTKYYDFPYLKPISTIPAEKVSLTPEESGWKPWKE